MWTNDPVADAEHYWWQQEEEAKKYPACDCCGETMFDFCYDFGGQLLCSDCVDKQYKKDVEDYVD